MPSNGEQQPPERGDQERSGGPGQEPSAGKGPTGPPEYTVYKSRRGTLSRLRSPDVSSLRDRARRSYRRLGRGGPQVEDQPPTAPKPLLRRSLKWIGIAAGVWVLISFLAFAVSAQLQEFKLAGGAKSVLHGNPFLIASPQTILLIGTDARPPNTKEPGAAPSQGCFEQQSHGDAPHGSCSQGQFRADTLMLIRAGGGHFRKLSIPRDSFAEIYVIADSSIDGTFDVAAAAGRRAPRTTSPARNTVQPNTRTTSEVAPRTSDGKSSPGSTRSARETKTQSLPGSPRTTSVEMS